MLGQLKLSRLLSPYFSIPALKFFSYLLAGSLSCGSHYVFKIIILYVKIDHAPCIYYSLYLFPLNTELVKIMLTLMDYFK